MLAIDTWRTHTYAGMRTKDITFHFIESHLDRAEHLKSLLSTYDHPPSARWTVYEGEFDPTFNDLVTRMTTGGRGLPPTFTFIDPFGYSDTPMSTIRRFMQYPSCEVLVYFAYENINRSLTFDNAANQAHYDALFGTNSWRSIDVTKLSPDDREIRIHDLYQAQLHNAGGARYVRSFRMRNKNNGTEYFLYFGTNNLKGLDKMKYAMWKVDPWGAYDFSDFTNTDDPVLFKPQPDYSILRSMVKTRFGGQPATVAQVEEYVIADTPYYSGHYKVNVLKPMEAEGEIEPISPPPGRKKGTYADAAMRILFH